MAVYRSQKTGRLAREVSRGATMPFDITGKAVKDGAARRRDGRIGASSQYSKTASRYIRATRESRP